MIAATCNWPIGNNQIVEFTIYPKNEGWKHVAGIYIFSYHIPSGWVPLYVGQTDDFAKRPSVHERLDEAVQLGATHIHARVVPLQADRDRMEKALIAALQPPMNTQHRNPFRP
jgi:hypothetical protein